MQDLRKECAERLLTVDLVMYRFSLNELLTEASDLIWKKMMVKLSSVKKVKDFEQARADWMGRNLKGKDLRATDFRGAYLIAADLRKTDLRAVNFIGADLRDADLSGANLSTSMFLTQMQISSAKGDTKTVLPPHIQRPSHFKVK